MLADFELYTTAQDYSHPEVQERKLVVIEETVTRFHVDGVELDFMRHPVFFSRTVRGEEVTARESGLMTEVRRA